MATSPKVWMITGCSTGFGHVLAQAVLARGDKALVTARDVTALEDLVRHYPEAARAMPLDVTRPGDGAAAVAAAEQHFRRLDVLVNNAGFGLVGAVEEVVPEEYRPMFETNVFGLIEMTRAALPALRRCGGRIVNFSSVGGITGRAGFGLYNATKFAVEGLSEALAEEVAPFGVSVIIVEPGPFRTGFLGRSIAIAKQRLPEYDATGGLARAYQERENGAQLGDPERGMAVLLEAVDAPEPPLRLPLGADAYQRIRSKLDQLNADIAAWQSRGSDTAFAA